MTRKTAMLSSAAAFALIGAMIGPAPSALADPVPADPVPGAASYADLLEPVPDAMARLHADDEMAANARVIPAGLNIGIGINLHHHHHHHHHSARWYRSRGYYWNGQFWIQGPPPPPYWHHHHSDWYRGNGYSWDGRAWIAPREHHHHHHHHHHNWR